LGEALGDRFTTTRWSLVLTAARGDDSGEALEWLCRTYWFPLYGFVRSKGHDAESARDLTQSFFLSLLERKDIRKLDPELGKFRAFLLAAMKNFLANEREREQALKRRTDDPAFHVDLSEAERWYAHGSIDGMTPDEIFEAKWARTVLDRALERLRDDAGEPKRFHQLSRYLTGEEPDYTGVAEGLGTTPGALRVAVHRLRRKLGNLLRDEVAQTVADLGDVDAELRSLLQACSRTM
jgi:RNA polymerase sigma-70 factor (ECF subfamily)